MEISVSSFQTVAIAVVVYYVGKYLKQRISFFNEYCIPNPVIGGILFALVNLGLHQSGLLIMHMDTILQSFFMTMFFTSIGFTASIKVLKEGGKEVFKMVLLCAVLIIFQNSIGVALAKVFNINALIGLCAGSIPMVGGHGTSGAFGPMLETMGADNATTVALAMATFGLIMGSLIGGPIAHRIIQRDHLHGADQGEDVTSMDKEAVVPLVPERFMLGQGQVLFCMGLGTILTHLFVSLHVVFPAYIGGMLMAALVRNISDSTGKYEVPIAEIQTVGSVGLNIFLSMALMSLKIWDLFGLAGPLTVMALAQTVLMALFAYFIVYRFMGKGYEAAVMTSAVCGFGMGATPNAMANMSAITAKYGHAPRAFFVVPLVGGLFVDFVNASIITVFINLFK